MTNARVEGADVESQVIDTSLELAKRARNIGYAECIDWLFEIKQAELALRLADHLGLDGYEVEAEFQERYQAWQEASDKDGA